MSQEASLFIVVEGRDVDVPFYEGIAKSSPSVRAKGYQIWLVEQITREVRSNEGATSRSAGGKQAVLALFDLYKAAGILSVSNSHGRRSVIFCVDKDMDDVAKVLRRSSHVAYTPMADAEACVFAFADPVAGLVRATSLSEADAREFVNQHPDPMGDLANIWRAWIQLCALAIAHSAHCHVGTTKPSSINHQAYGAVDRAEVAIALRLIRRKSQLPVGRHASLERRVSERIARLYASGNGRRLVGKHWIIPYLRSRLGAFFGNAPIGLANIKHKAPVAYLSALDFSGGWATPYRRRFEGLL